MYYLGSFSFSDGHYVLTLRGHCLPAQAVPVAEPGGGRFRAQPGSSSCPPGTKGGEPEPCKNIAFLSRTAIVWKW